MNWELAGLGVAVFVLIGLGLWFDRKNRSMFGEDVPPPGMKNPFWSKAAGRWIDLDDE